ncbi:type II toxin-antitoxin system HicB family antitoxin [Nocardiopsis sp. CC223A]|uniref:type II toxin-antitoxin system HicB family antitoxin n=1 Tax=Nocardiopsis sp. CC223A TaxID=3044051 RepID=UPI00278C01DB|nr:type II toxin-antitoxin system HicB family antitoxin [Nocardiopsis sp. CC223A]
MNRVDHHYEAWCERDGRSWSIDVPELRIHTYAHTLGEAEEMARDAVAGVLDVPMGEVSVALDVQGVEDRVARARTAGEARDLAVLREREALAGAIDALRGIGAGRRDIALLLGISHQRVSQISAERSRTAG